LAYAHRFMPELWLQPRGDRDWPLIPFSDGPGFCPGEQLALLMGSTMLAGLLGGGQVRLRSRVPLDPGRPLPGTLNPYALSFGLSAP
jgi:cytochrome P450